MMLKLPTHRTLNTRFQLGQVVHSERACTLLSVTGDL